VLFKVIYFSFLESIINPTIFVSLFFSSVSVVIKFLPSISLNSFQNYIFFGFIGKISLLLAILSSARNFRIAMNGVTPAPPAMNTPSPLYSIAPQTSRMISSSPCFNFPNSFVTPL
jgi:hypothetical protein